MTQISEHYQTFHSSPRSGYFRETLNNSSLNSQSEKSEKLGFHFSLKINDLQPLILAAHPCAAGATELIRGSLAFKPRENQVIAFEAKSYLDSPGVKLAELQKKHEIPEGRYKLFTCDNYRNIVFSRMKEDLISLGMGTHETQITLGLAAGNVYQSKSDEIRSLFNESGWAFLSPEDIRDKVTDLAAKGYENEPSIITTKILMR